MRINCHSHVFNLQTVFTPCTRQLLADRLKRQGIAKPIRTLLVNLASAVIGAKSKYAPVSGLGSMDELRKIADTLQLPDLDGTPLEQGPGKTGAVELEELRESLRGVVQLDTLYQQKLAMDRAVSTLVPPDVDARYSTILDWLEFLRTSLSGMDQITDKLFSGMGKDDVIVALMVEYYAPNDRKVDRQYMAQIEGTLRQALRRPGRVLPFFGVDTRRPNHYKIMRAYLEEGSCLGIKIYPSAGFPVDDPLMERVFAACEELDVPVLVHCGTAGFCDSQCIDFASPRHWDAILQRHPKLRVCFGHFGGDVFFVRDNKTMEQYPDSWMTMILKLMKKYPGRVYADISYHDAYGKPELKEKYKSAFNSIINQYPHQVLWGTDYIMLLMNMADSTYIKLFEQLISASTFDRIARTNAMAYLGIDEQFRETHHRANVARHLEWLRKQKAADKLLPPTSKAKWLPTNF